jgi:hypothetical protein
MVFLKCKKHQFDVFEIINTLLEVINISNYGYVLNTFEVDPKFSISSSFLIVKIRTFEKLQITN